MAGWLSLIDKALGTDFDAPQYDPAKGRKKLVRVIDTAATQHDEGKTPPTRSWKLGNNNAVRFSPKIDGKPLLINGEPDSYVPAERFQEFLKGLKAAVEAGDLDAEIKAAIEGDGDGAADSVSAPKRSGGGSSRSFSTQSALNIGVAGMRRGTSPRSFEDIRKAYIDKGSDPSEIDTAIATRKAAEAQNK